MIRDSLHIQPSHPRANPPRNAKSGRTDRPPPETHVEQQLTLLVVQPRQGAPEPLVPLLSLGATSSTSIIAASLKTFGSSSIPGKTRSSKNAARPMSLASSQLRQCRLGRTLAPAPRPRCRRPSRSSWSGGGTLAASTVTAARALSSPPIRHCRRALCSQRRGTRCPPRAGGTADLHRPPCKRRRRRFHFDGKFVTRPCRQQRRRRRRRRRPRRLSRERGRPPSRPRGGGESAASGRRQHRRPT